MPNPEFEAECIRRILAGEKHLFHDLIRPCERSIYFLLLSLLKNETEAEDAAQETVIKVYLNLASVPRRLAVPHLGAFDRPQRGAGPPAQDREPAAKNPWKPKPTSRPGITPPPS